VAATRLAGNVLWSSGSVLACASHATI